MANSDSVEVNVPLSPYPESPAALSGATFGEQQENAANEQTTHDVESLRSGRQRQGAFSRLLKLCWCFPVEIPYHWKPGNRNPRHKSRRLEEYPDGFPRFAAWMNLDENFLLTRRYGWLHNRVMMFHQSQLHDLEVQLEAVDEDLATEEAGALASHQTFVQGVEGEEREALMLEIDKKLEQYDSIVMRAKQMASLPEATRRNYASVYNRLGNEGPIVQSEAKVYMNDLDCAALVEHEESKAVDGYIEDILGMMPCQGLTHFLFRNAEQRDITNDETVLLYDKKRIDTLIRLVMAVLAVALLLAPVVVLFREEDSGTIKIIVILVFTLFFSLALSMATRARRAEVFGATAAYCAVLVVFLGNFIPGSSAAISS